MSAKGTPWCKLHSQLREHPKGLDLADALGVDHPQAIGHLVLLWCWITDYYPDGELGAIGPMRIERAAEWTGPRGALMGALIDCGWIDRDTETGHMSAHNWMTYAESYRRAVARAEQRTAVARQSRHDSRSTAVARQSQHDSRSTVVTRNPASSRAERSGAESSSSSKDPVVGQLSRDSRATQKIAPAAAAAAADLPTAGQLSVSKAVQALISAAPSHWDPPSRAEIAAMGEIAASVSSSAWQEATAYADIHANRAPWAYAARRATDRAAGIRSPKKRATAPPATHRDDPAIRRAEIGAQIASLGAELPPAAVLDELASLDAEQTIRDRLADWIADRDTPDLTQFVHQERDRRRAEAVAGQEKLKSLGCLTGNSKQE